jgi:Chaperone of endosialidase
MQVRSVLIRLGAALAVISSALVVPSMGSAAPGRINASSVDGFSAVGCTTSLATRAGKLMAFCKSGELPNNVIVLAPNSAKLSGKTLSQVLAMAWKTKGNAGTSPSTNFLGTTDDQPLLFKVHGQQALELLPTTSTPNILGGFSGNDVVAGVIGATIAGGGADSGNGNSVTDDFGAVGGGSDNQAGDAAGTTSDHKWATVSGGCCNSARGSSSTVSGGFTNDASGDEATIGGGDSNIADGLRATVAGGFTNHSSAENATVGGGSENTASGGSATVGGGFSNSVNGGNATVAGGTANVASGGDATVGGGVSNTATDVAAAVAGGGDNNATGNSSFVGGGLLNNATGQSTAVLGGAQNTASGPQSAVAGGVNDTTSGFTSFAAGNNAKADDSGSFVWSDSSNSGLFAFHSNTFPCIREVSMACDPSPTSGVNTFNVRATGGVRFVTAMDGANNIPAAGCYLDTGGNVICTGTFSQLSDRRAKRDLRAVTSVRVAREVASLPITTWSYRNGSPSVRHMGPMAQAFWRTFHIGAGSTSIDTIDEGGVALAGIKGLFGMERVQERATTALRGQLAHERAVDRHLAREIAHQGREIAALQREVRAVLRTTRS